MCLDESAPSTRSREQTLSSLPGYCPGELTSEKNAIPHSPTILKASGVHCSPTLEPLNPKPLNGYSKTTPLPFASHQMIMIGSNRNISL